jgi:hypothetical protein
MSIDKQPEFDLLPKDVQDALRKYDEFAQKASVEQPLTNEELTRYVYSANSTFALMTDEIITLARQVDEMKKILSEVVIHLEATHGAMEDEEPPVPPTSGLVN